MPKTPEYTKKAINNYREKFDFIQVRFPKGTKEKLEEVGDKNSFIVNCVLNALDGSRNTGAEKVPKRPESGAETAAELARDAEKIRSEVPEFAKTAEELQAYILREQQKNAEKRSQAKPISENDVKEALSEKQKQIRNIFNKNNDSKFNV